MKIYEYAKNRNIKSKDVVTKLHELGFAHIKNHLSLVPEKIIDVLDSTQFETYKKEEIEIKNIVFISMECAPFISKGLGDMVYNKIQYSVLNGNNNIVILPKYNIDLNLLNYVTEINISVNHNNKIGKIYKCEYEKAYYYFVESEYYFNRDKLYGFSDDPERYAFLAKAAIELIKYLSINIDIINVHDWPFGLFPILFKESLSEQFPNTKIEFSVYGSTYQGIYGVDVLTDVYELNQRYYNDHTVEFANSVNFLKSGLVTADKVDINKVALIDLKNSYLKDFIYDNM